MATNRVTGKGGYNVICDECGFKYKNNELVRRYDGFMVCRKCWEPRHPQEFVRARKDSIKLPYVRPDDSGLSYTPTWSLVPVIGEGGEVTGKYTTYTDSSNDKVVLVTVHALIGTNPTFSADPWTISLPETNGSQEIDGYAEVITNGKVYTGIAILEAASSTVYIKDQNDNRRWTRSIPHSWTIGDRLFMSIRYSTAT